MFCVINIYLDTVLPTAAVSLLVSQAETYSRREGRKGRSPLSEALTNTKYMVITILFHDKPSTLLVPNDLIRNQLPI